MKNKNLYIIAGCNGAGKTTASFTILPEILDCKEFVNADEIAKGLSPFQPDKVALEAGRIMISRIKKLFSIYMPFVDELMIFDNSQVKSELIASKSNDSSLIIRNEQKFNYLKSYYEKA